MSATVVVSMNDDNKQLCDLMRNFIQVVEGIVIHMKNEPHRIDELYNELSHRCMRTEEALNMLICDKEKLDG